MFIEISANKSSINKRKLLFDAGINDADYNIATRHNSGMHRCPYYRKWADMIKRCYSQKFKESHPSYSECQVSDDWKRFSNFKKWMKKQDWEGKELDKDILYPGNKIYSVKTCVFVPHSINSLLTHIQINKGKYPTGVSFDKGRNKFAAEYWINGKRKHLGRFVTPEEASNEYKKAKRKEILRQANIQTDDRIRQGLMLHAEAL